MFEEVTVGSLNGVDKIALRSLRLPYDHLVAPCLRQSRTYTLKGIAKQKVVCAVLPNKRDEKLIPLEGSRAGIRVLVSRIVVGFSSGN